MTSDPPILCPLCQRNFAGPKRQEYACNECVKLFVEESLEKIIRAVLNTPMPNTPYSGGGTTQ